MMPMPWVRMLLATWRTLMVFSCFRSAAPDIRSTNTYRGGGGVEGFKQGGFCFNHVFFISSTHLSFQAHVLYFKHAFVSSSTWSYLQARVLYLKHVLFISSTFSLLQGSVLCFKHAFFFQAHGLYFKHKKQPQGLGVLMTRVGMYASLFQAGGLYFKHTRFISSTRALFQAHVLYFKHAFDLLLVFIILFTWGCKSFVSHHDAGVMSLMFVPVRSYVHYLSVCVCLIRTYALFQARFQFSSNLGPQVVCTHFYFYLQAFYFTSMPRLMLIVMGYCH
jgi:hypothetical protein